ncbi:MAG: enoyl-CoA hydratase/isomerase family protein [Pontixanthobacter sp.]
MSIRFEHDGAVGRVLIDRSARRNAMTLSMWRELSRVLIEAMRLPELRVLTLQAADGTTAFCAGADLRELIDHADDADWLADYRDALFEAQRRLAGFDLPTIAFVAGDCIGAGCAMATACDVRIAAPQARFAITPARLGLIYPFHDTRRMVHLIGPGQARRLLFTGEWIDVAEARAIGMIEAVASGPERMERRMAVNAPTSNRAMKAMVDRVINGQTQEDAWTNATFTNAFAGPDFQEGADAFLRKRPPNFSDSGG